MKENREKLDAYLKKIEEVIENGPYKADTWKTLLGHKVPDWYRNAKFGIFIHWGPYAVPAYATEWYSCLMHNPQGETDGTAAGTNNSKKGIYQHHVDSYGSVSEFNYTDFIPIFRAEKFDPSAWADLFQEAGAKFVMPVAEHCDGFQMYDSDLSDWCASKKGPMKDTLGLLKVEFEKRGMVLATSSHRVEHYWFMGGIRELCPEMEINYGDLYWPSYKKEFELEDGTLTDEQNVTNLVNLDPMFMEDWLARTCEIVDKYQPKIMYFDWWIQVTPMKPYLRKFAAYYYNRALEWGEEVTINYKNDAFPHTVGVKDIERGQLTDVSPFFWQNDTAIARNSWCYTENNDFKPVSEVICTLVDVVSKNGSLCLNVGPKADGSISAEDSAVLKGVGAWLKINGEAIYDSIPWRKYGEGPTKTEEGHFSDKNFKVYTKEDFRFTYKDGVLYVFAMNYPADGVLRILNLGRRPRKNQFNGHILNVSILGQNSCDFTLCEEYLTVIGEKVSCDVPVCIKIEFE